MRSDTEEPVESRVGSIVVRHLTPPEGDAAYRSRWRGPLEIECVSAPLEQRSPGVVSALVAVLGLGLLGFAAYVRSGPAIGTVSLALLALAWLVFRSRGAGERENQVVRVDDDRLTVGGVEEPVRVPVAEVERVGVGRDAASLRTLWVRLTSRGRVLLLSRLTENEAQAAAGALREALDACPPAGAAAASADVRVELPEPAAEEPDPAAPAGASRRQASGGWS
jgi:hypothetical protein